jgi:hypothetical protein
MEKLSNSSYWLNEFIVCEERLLEDGGEGYIGCYEEDMIKYEGNGCLSDHSFGKV